jgi:hypothetical protein
VFEEEEEEEDLFKAEAVNEVDRVPMNLPQPPQVSADLPQVHQRKPSYDLSFRRWTLVGRRRGGGGGGGQIAYTFQVD